MDSGQSFGISLNIKQKRAVSPPAESGGNFLPRMTEGEVNQCSLLSVYWMFFGESDLVFVISLVSLAANNSLKPSASW